MPMPDLGLPQLQADGQYYTVQLAFSKFEDANVAHGLSASISDVAQLIQ